ncbi:MAG: TolC family protein [Deltaproteobacteria bacterium]|nr:TolC family protein [Deltaproteobacteria bacterium]
MHRPFAAVLVLVAGAAQATDGEASAPAAPSLVLTLHDALRLAAERAPIAVLARQRVAVARGRLLAAQPWLADNPTLAAGAAARAARAGVSADLDVSLAQALEIGGQQAARRDAGVAGISEATALSDDAVRLAMAHAGEAFIDAVVAARSLELAKQTLDRTEQLARVTARRQAAGEISGVDARLADAQLARARAGIAAAGASCSVTLGALRVALGASSDTAITLAPDWQTVLTTGETTERADVRVAKAARDRVDAELRLADAAAWPSLEASTGYALDGGDHLLGAAVAVQLPLFARGQGAAAAARAERAALDLEIEALRSSASTEVASARAALEQRRLARTAIADAVDAAREGARLARRAYEAGETSLADLLVIEREALAIEEEQITVQADEARQALAAFIAEGASP